MFHENLHLSNESMTSVSDINDGKLTRKFYLFFIGELVRDYLHTNNSFLDGNVASLLKITKPLYPAKFEEITDPKEIEKANLNGNIFTDIINNKEYIKKGYSFGTGNIILNEEKNEINKSSEYKLKDLTPFKSYKFIKINKNRLTILVPKHFENNYLMQIFDKRQIKLVYAKRNELNQLVTDFVRSLNIKTITKPQDITTRIKSFNYNIVKRLTNLNTKI